jgi:hypothetical protein
MIAAWFVVILASSEHSDGRLCPGYMPGVRARHVPSERAFTWLLTRPWSEMGNSTPKKASVP